MKIRRHKFGNLSTKYLQQKNLEIKKEYSDLKFFKSNNKKNILI